MKETKLRKFILRHPMRTIGISAGIGAFFSALLASVIGVKLHKRKKKQ